MYPHLIWGAVALLAIVAAFVLGYMKLVGLAKMRILSDLRRFAADVQKELEAQKTLVTELERRRVEEEKLRVSERGHDEQRMVKMQAAYTEKFDELHAKVRGLEKAVY